MNCLKNYHFYKEIYSYTFLTSLDDLKDFIKHACNVDHEHQLLLTAKTAGQLKFDAVADGQQVFLYDRSKIKDQAANNVATADANQVMIPAVPSVPSTTGKNIFEIFEHRAMWAQKCLDIFENIEPKCLEISQQLNVVRTGVATAKRHMENQCRVLEKSFESKVDFAMTVESDLSAMTEWRKIVVMFNAIAVPESTGGGTLHRFVDMDLLETTAKQLEEKRNTIRKQMKSLSGEVKNIVLLTRELTLAADALITPKHSSKSNAVISETFQDLEALVYKVKRDAEYVSSLRESPTNDRNAARIQTLHEKEFIPQITSLGDEISDLYSQITGERSACQRGSIAYLRKVSLLQYHTSLLKPKIQEITQQLHDLEEQRVVIGRAIDIPFLFGIFMIELSRRTNFMKGLRIAVSNSAEVMATCCQEEEQRRIKFRKQYGSFNLLKMKDDVPGIDVNLAGNNDEEEQEVTMQDLENYLAAIKSAGLVEEYQELRAEMQEKIASSKIAATRAFKSSPISVSFEVTPDDSRIKGYESRIRKLEDLLHREQYKNLQNSTVIRDGNKASSPSRLIQTLHDLEEQKGRDRELISRLEKEIDQLRSDVVAAHQEARATCESSPEQLKLKQDLETLHQELENRSLEHKDELADANKIKEDLLANLSAQDAEFSEERKHLLAEIASLKEKLDKLEDGNTLNNGDVSRLENELEKTRRELDKSRAKTKACEEELHIVSKRLVELDRDNLRLRQSKEKLDVRSRDLSQRLYTSYKRSCELLESMGLQASKEVDGTAITFTMNRVRGLSHRRVSPKSTELLRDASAVLDSEDQVDSGKGELNVPTDLLYWMENSEDDDERYARFMNEVYIDYDTFRDSVVKRFGDMEHLARKLQREVRLHRDKNHKSQDEGKYKLSLRNFKEGDLVLFLPTRDPTRVPNPWAAFNVGAPHYFLKQTKDHRLETREYLVARVTKIEDRVVNKATDTEEDNPFDLSDGLRWHLLEAKPEW